MKTKAKQLLIAVFSFLGMVVATGINVLASGEAEGTVSGSAAQATQASADFSDVFVWPIIFLVGIGAIFVISKLRNQG